MFSSRFILLLVAIIPLVNFLVYPLVILLFFYVLFKGEGTKIVGEIKKDKGLFFFLTAVLISTMFSGNPGISIGAFAVFITQVLFYLYIRSTHSLDRHKLIEVLSVTGGIVALIGIIQYLFIDIFIPPRWLDTSLYGAEQYKRVFSTFLNPNVLAGYLIFIISISISTLHNKYSYLVLPLSLSCLIFTFSRGGWIGTAIAVCTVLLLKRESKLSSIILIACTFFLLGFWSMILGRISGVLNFRDSTLLYRIEIWKTAFSVFIKHPLVGCGFGTAWKVIPEVSTEISALVGHAHNLYLNFAMETGIAGLFAFIWFYISRVFKGYNRLKSLENTDRDVVIGLIGGFVGTAFHGMVDAVPIAPQFGIIIWSFIGLLEII